MEKLSGAENEHPTLDILCHVFHTSNSTYSNPVPLRLKGNSSDQFPNEPWHYLALLGASALVVAYVAIILLLTIQYARKREQREMYLQGQLVKLVAIAGCVELYVLTLMDLVWIPRVLIVGVILFHFIIIGGCIENTSRLFVGRILPRKGIALLALLSCAVCIFILKLAPKTDAICDSEFLVRIFVHFVFLSYPTFATFVFSRMLFVSWTTDIFMMMENGKKIGWYIKKDNNEWTFVKSGNLLEVVTGK